MKTIHVREALPAERFNVTDQFFAWFDKEAAGTMTPTELGAITKLLRGYKALVDHKEQIISVCAWCFPGDQIFEICPELLPFKHYRISHGMCKPCAEKIRAET
jgi:hypothetical protein